MVIHMGEGLVVRRSATPSFPRRRGPSGSQFLRVLRYLCVHG